MRGNIDGHGGRDDQRAREQIASTHDIFEGLSAIESISRIRRFAFIFSFTFYLFLLFSSWFRKSSSILCPLRLSSSRSGCAPSPSANRKRPSCSPAVTRNSA